MNTKELVQWALLQSWASWPDENRKMAIEKLLIHSPSMSTVCRRRHR